jgi:hypothetical protein
LPSDVLERRLDSLALRSAPVPRQPHLPEEHTPGLPLLVCRAGRVPLCHRRLVRLVHGNEATPVPASVGVQPKRSAPPEGGDGGARISSEKLA